MYCINNIILTVKHLYLLCLVIISNTHNVNGSIELKNNKRTLSTQGNTIKLKASLEEANKRVVVSLLCAIGGVKNTIT